MRQTWIPRKRYEVYRGKTLERKKVPNEMYYLGYSLEESNGVGLTGETRLFVVLRNQLGKNRVSRNIILINS